MLRSLDVRQALPLVQAPTLVLHVRDVAVPPTDHGRYLADHIPTATFVELPGADFAVVASRADVIDEVAEFFTGERPPAEIERRLATVLFTDIVGSTQRAVSLGDRRFRAVLDAHDRAVRQQLRRFGGREVNTTGDGFVASFDGPAGAIRCTQAITGAPPTSGSISGLGCIRASARCGATISAASASTSLLGSEPLLPPVRSWCPAP
jgi:hypothetical protein